MEISMARFVFTAVSAAVAMYWRGLLHPVRPLPLCLPIQAMHPKPLGAPVLSAARSVAKAF